MSLLDWAIFGLVWALVPAVLIAKAAMDRRQAKSERECWEKVDRILRRSTHD